MSAHFRGTVTRVEVDPGLRHPLRRYLVTVRVDEVLDGHLDGDEVSLLVHSPSRTFRSSNPLNESFDLTLTEPLTDPYAGELLIES